MSSVHRFLLGAQALSPTQGPRGLLEAENPLPSMREGVRLVIWAVPI
jgi:hypothetical protein